MRKVLVVIGLIFLGIFLLGCTQPQACTADAKICPDGSTVGRVPPKCEFAPCPSTTVTGNLTLYLTDKQIRTIEGLETLNVVISGIAVHKDGNWVSIPMKKTKFDLMQLMGVKDFIGSKELEPGTYTQIRLKVESATAVIEGNSFEVKVPSDSIKLVNSFEITEGEETELILDFSPEDLHETGMRQYILQPTIKVLTQNQFQERKTCRYKTHFIPAGTHIEEYIAPAQCWVETTTCIGEVCTGPVIIIDCNSSHEVCDDIVFCDCKKGKAIKTEKGTDETTECGNGIKETGENCLNCPTDMPANACNEKQAPAQGQGSLLLSITDKHIEGLTELNVTINEVMVHKAYGDENGEWVLFSDAVKTFDIMKLNGVTDIIDQNALDAGHYTQIRLNVIDSNIVIMDGNSLKTFAVKVPSDKIKLVHEFDIYSDEVKELVIDFSPESVKLAGKQYIMSPVIKIISPKDVNKRREQNRG